MEKATDFELPDAQNRKVKLSSLWATGPLMVVFYPGDFTPVCTAQLCDYRDNFEGFAELGVNLVGISADSPSKHADFATEHGFKFPLLSDPGQTVAKAFGCTSMWTFGKINRANCLVNQKGEIVWKKVEPFGATRRRASELKDVIEVLKKEGKL